MPIGSNHLLAAKPCQFFARLVPIDNLVIFIDYKHGGWGAIDNSFSRPLLPARLFFGCLQLLALFFNLFFNVQLFVLQVANVPKQPGHDVVHQMHMGRFFMLNCLTEIRITGKFDNQIQIRDAKKVFVVRRGECIQGLGLPEAGGLQVSIRNTHNVHLKLPKLVPGYHVHNGQATRTGSYDSDIVFFH